MALTDFQRENPPGKFRKRKIEWAQWKKQHGIRIACIHDENSELLDIDDFCIYMEDKKRKTRLWSEAEFKRLLTTDIDREGEGPLVKIWFEKNPTRKKRTERFVQNELDEGCKTMKDPSKEDRQTLTDFALSSAASHSDRFFHGNELTPVKEAAEEVETEGLKSKKVVDVCDAAAKASEKFSKVMPGLQKLAETILSETQTRLELESRHQDSGAAELQDHCVEQGEVGGHVACRGHRRC